MTESQQPRLLDFLYADHERVASFLAQLFGDGVPKEEQQTASTKKSGGLKGKTDFRFVGGEASSDRDWSKEVRRSYDPLWANSRRLIDHVAEQSILDNGQASLSQLRAIEGRLMAYDLSAITHLMSSDSMEEFLAKGMIPDNENFEKRSAKVRNDLLTEKRKEASALRSLLHGLPLGTGFVLVSENASYWFSVKKEYLSLYDLDVPMKFPVTVSGNWKVLGVVDATPNDQLPGIADITEINNDADLPFMATQMIQMTMTISLMFGRPSTAHGLSPLVVYREVTY